MRELTHRPGRFARYVERHRVPGGFYLYLLQLVSVFLPVPTQSRKRWSFFAGYFWLPCCVCGEWQSGRDWTPVEGHETAVPTSRFAGRGICTACARDGVGDRAWAKQRVSTGAHMSINLDRNNACCALSSPVVGRLRCQLDVYHRDAHEAPLKSGALYCWYDAHDTVAHWDSPCVVCGKPLGAHRAAGDRCPEGDGRFRASEGGA